MSEKLSHIFLAGLGLMLFAGFLFLAGRFVLPWTAPLLTAWVLAALLEPAVNFLLRHRWKRCAAATAQRWNPGWTAGSARAA